MALEAAKLCVITVTNVQWHKEFGRLYHWSQSQGFSVGTPFVRKSQQCILTLSACYKTHNQSLHDINSCSKRLLMAS